MNETETSPDRLREEMTTSPLIISKLVLLRNTRRLPALSTGAASGCNEEKTEAGDSSSAANGDRKRHPTEREKMKASSSRKRGDGSSAVAEAKGGQGAVSGDVRDGDKKGAERGLALLGDLPSLGRKMVSLNIAPKQVVACQGQETSPAKLG